MIFHLLGLTELVITVGRLWVGFAHCRQQSSTDRYRETLPLGLRAIHLKNQAVECVCLRPVCVNKPHRI
jgi:hypothetical protein